MAEQMRIIVTLVIILIAVGGGTLQAGFTTITGVDIVEQSYYVRGSARYVDPLAGIDVSDSYEVTDTMPLFRWVQVGVPESEGNSSAIAMSGAGPGYIDVQASAYSICSDGGDCYDMPLEDIAWADAGAIASSHLVFVPRAETLAVCINTSTYFSDYDIHLMDLTSGQVLLALQEDGRRDDWQQTWGVDPSHTYALDLLASVEVRSMCGEGHDVDSTFCQVGIMCTPAPGALLLSTIGMGFVGWLRRRRVV